jgi:hypothetical protein
MPIAGRILVNPVRWRVLAATTAGLMCVSATLGGVAASAAEAGQARPAVTGIKGDPQPELKPFKIAGTGSGGASAAIESNGAMVVAYDVANGDGKVVVCVLNRGASKCASSVTLSPLSGDDTEGTPSAYVFTPSANHVVVLMSSCCDSNVNGGDLVFTSTNGGRTFGAPVRVGSAGMGAAALVGSQIVFESGGSDGAGVEAVPALGATAPPAATATAFTATSYAQGVGSYRGGALIASQYDGSKVDSTYVAYAPKGKNFNATGSYHKVGSFSDEELEGMSGNALLTETASGALRVRLFNGTAFGPAHTVPALGHLGGPVWWGFDQDPRGQVHVISDRAFEPVSYHVYIQSSATGAAWSSPLNLGDGSTDDYFGVALDSLGSGLVVGTADHEPVWAYPVLAPQGVSFSLKNSTIAKGHSTVASGKGSPIGKGRAVQLQVERSGLWYWVATTHENASGAFSFTIKGTTAGTRDYRAMVSDFAGYLQFGYSAARALKVS